MGQFKPMVKMMTTEPTVELKLAKGGAVAMKKGGSTTKAKKMAMGGDSGMASAMMGAPRIPSGPVGGSAAPVVGPKRPSMAMRRKAMKPPMAAPMASAPMMKKGGSAHDDAAEDRAMIKKAMAGKKFATGGVVNGQGGYKDGGSVIPVSASAKGAEGYKNTKMHTAKPDHSPAKTGGVKNGNGGGYATGGVAKSNAGGYKNGGAPKKAYATGGVVDSGKPVAMPQGRKKPSSPVSINQLSGTFKKGGKVTPAEGALQAVNKTENASAMKAAKSVKLDQYSKYQKPVKKMATGGDPNRAAWEADERKFNEGLRSDVSDALMYIPRKIKKAFNGMTGQGAVTTTEREVSKTVSPPSKKRGGAC
jgi:hypothetical protein